MQGTEQHLEKNEANEDRLSRESKTTKQITWVANKSVTSKLQ